MLRGYRYVIAAVVVWDAFVGAGSDHYARARTEQVKHKDDGSSQATTVRPTSPVFYFQEKDDPGCAPGVENRKSELCAQWQAVDVAAEANRYAAWQAVAGGLGLILGTGTLVAAIKAAKYAKRAAIATERTVEIAQNTAQSNLKPFLKFHGGSVHKSLEQTIDNMQIMDVSISIINAGSTEAGMTRANFSVIADGETPHYEPWSDYYTVNPNTVKTYTFKLIKEEGFWEKAISNAEFMAIHMHVEYANIFDKPQSNSVSVKMQPNGLLTYVHSRVT